jgi:hypothetical protein
MSAKDVLFKRRIRPVEIDGDKLHVRSLTLREATEVDRLKEANQSVEAAIYSVAHCLVEADGTEVFNGDSDTVRDIPLDTLHALGEAIAEVSAAAKAKDIRKNSDAAPSSLK